MPSVTRAPIYDETLELVRSLPHGTTLKDVAKACGLKLSWLTAFARGEIKDPSVNKVYCLHKYLKGEANV